MWATLDVPKVYLTALCAWREARGCSVEAIRGVLHTIRNRALQPSWWGNGWVGVVLKPMQFSSFNAGDPNATKFPAADDKVFATILELTERVIQGQDDDISGGATHYHDSTVNPEWATKMTQTAIIGTFKFYR